MNNDTRAKCTACGIALDPYSSEPCPNCGRTDTKKVYKSLAGTISVTVSLDRVKTHSFLTFNRFVIVALVVIALVSPLMGLLLPRGPALLAGYGLSVMGAVVGYFAILRVREIERYIGTQVAGENCGHGYHDSSVGNLTKAARFEGEDHV